MQNIKKGRNSYWDNLKGILIILVVCGHLCERYIDDSSLLKHLWIMAYSFHMPLFIFVNGYFARKSSRPAVGKSLKMLKYYLLMQVLFVLGNWLIQKKDLEISILSDPSYCCWYLIFLVWAYLITAVLPKESDRLLKWTGASIILSLLVGFDVSVGHAYGVGRTFYFLPYFLMGAWWADTGREIRSTKKKKAACAMVAVVVFFFVWQLGSADWFNRSVFSGHKSYEALYPDHLLFGLVNKAGAYILAIVLAYLVANIVPRRKTVFCFFGRHTLLIYLVHIFVLPMEFYLIKDIVFVKWKEFNSFIILLILAVTSAIICLMLSLLYRWVFQNLISTIKRENVFERRSK